MFHVICKEFNNMKFNKIVLSVFSVFCLLHTELQAVGGQDVEVVSSDECFQKGIVRIYTTDGRFTGSGVLFKEGNGYLGLTAKHVADEFLNNQQVLKEKANVDIGDGRPNEAIVFYTNPDQMTDLALFVLKEPVSEIEKFFELPKSSDPISVIKGNVYGFGATSAEEHPGALKNSNGLLCRKGELELAFMNKLNSYDMDSLNVPFGCMFGHYFLVSFAIPLKDKLIEEFSGIKKLKDEGICLKNSELLKSSPSYPLQGDSGGPIVQENKIMGLSKALMPRMEFCCKLDYKEPNDKNYEWIGDKVYNNSLISIFFHPENGFYGYLIEGPNVSVKQFEEIIHKEYYDFYLRGCSEYLDHFLKNSFNKEIKHLERAFQLLTVVMIPIQTNLEWIETVSNIALNSNKLATCFVEEFSK